MTRRRTNSAALLTVSLIALGPLSCSDTKSTEKVKPVHPVTGQVFVGDRPAAGAFVQFIPVLEAAQNQDPRPRATVQSDGSFKLSTYGAEDGAPAGDYVVTVVWPGGVLPDGREEPEDKLMGRYATPARPAAKVTVREGPNTLEPIRLK
jgi:hypothetical protein